MRSVWDLLDRIASLFAWAGGFLITCAALVVAFEVLCRKVLAIPFSGSDELAAYLFAIGTSWSFAFVLLNRAHIRIDVLYSMFSPLPRAFLDVVALCCLAVFVAALVDSSWTLLTDSYESWSRSNTPLRLPLIYPQALWFLGLLLFATTLIAAIVRSVMLLVRGDFAKVNAIIGIPAQDEEVRSELEGLGIALVERKTPKPC